MPRAESAGVLPQPSHAMQPAGSTWDSGEKSQKTIGIDIDVKPHRGRDFDPLQPPVDDALDVQNGDVVHPVFDDVHTDGATVTASGLQWFIFFEMLLFILLLGVGYVYVWKKNAFDWK